jgi:periplasmic protein TonB
MDDATSDRVSRQDLVRWAICAAAALVAHILFAVVVLAQPDDFDPEAGSPIVMVDLASIASAPSQVPNDLPPAPQVAPELEPQMQQEVEHKDKPPDEQVEETPARDPEDTLPKREPDPPKQEQEQEAKVEQQAQDASRAGAPQNAPLLASLPAAPAPGEVEQPTTAVVAKWERSLVAHLERFEHYPSNADGAWGVASVVFQIDRRGHVFKSRIAQSSGSSVLDQEALAMIERADPLPAPPNNIPDTKLSITTPIRFNPLSQH